MRRKKPVRRAVVEVSMGRSLRREMWEGVLKRRNSRRRASGQRALGIRAWREGTRRNFPVLPSPELRRSSQILPALTTLPRPKTQPRTNHRHIRKVTSKNESKAEEVSHLDGAMGFLVWT